MEVSAEEAARISAMFAPKALSAVGSASDNLLAADRAADASFAAWCDANTHAHRTQGYRSVTVSLKPTGGIPGDASAGQMDQIAALADQYAGGEIVVTHRQNLVFPTVRVDALQALWRALGDIGLEAGNVGKLGDIIACPGLDYCALANARSIPLAQEISTRFADLRRQHNIGPLTLNISGCINACGHHHVGNIGILGVDKRGEEYCQISLGGASDNDTAIGAILGAALSGAQITDAIETVVQTYLDIRTAADETFVDTVRRTGLDPFQRAVYGGPAAATGLAADPAQEIAA